MKCVKKIVRHYWKYIYEPWTQPILTDFTTNTQDGAIVVTESGHYSGSGEHEYAWYIMDGRKSGSSINTFWSALGNPMWCKVVFPYELNITAIKLYNRYQGRGAGAVPGQIYTSETKEATIGDAFTIPAGNWNTYNITGIPQEGITTNSFYIEITTGGIGEIEITATKRIVGEGTADDYDFFTDDEAALLPKISDKFYGINQ